MADSQWYRTMWDDQPATLMWMLHGWFAVTGASVEAARVLVTALMTVALSAVAARAESMAGRWAGLALTPLLLVNPELTQLMGACMLEPTSIALALIGSLLFWSRLERPTGWTIVGAVTPHRLGAVREIDGGLAGAGGILGIFAHPLAGSAG